MTIGDFLDRVKQGLGLQVSRQRNRPFLEAAMAACALVAYADEDVSLSERFQLDQVLERLEQLKAFDPHDGVNFFDEIVRELQEQPEAGKRAALERIGRFAGEPDAARLLVRVCHAISWADGEISDAERARIDEVCTVLGQDYEACIAS